MTVDKMVRRALQLIGVLEGGETPSAAAMSDGIDTLNEMLHAWASKGADTAHTTLSNGGELLVRDEFLEAVRFNLAIRLAPEYGSAVITNEILEGARTGFAAVQAHLFEFNDDLKVDDALDPRFFEHRIGAYDIDEQ